MAYLLGPVLQFLGIQNNRWCVSLLVVTDTSNAPTLKGAWTAAPFTRLYTLQSGANVWRATLSVLQGASAQRIAYTVDGKSNAMHVPATGESPRMVYASCNGFASPSLMKAVVDKNALWARLMNLHTGRERINGRNFGPYDVLLMGGDQVYSDAFWQDPTCLGIVEWSNLSRDQRRKVRWTPALQKQVTAFVENL
jgi:hypothetical protein